MRNAIFAVLIALTIANSAGSLFSAGAPEPAKTLHAVLDAPPPDSDTTPKAELLKIYLERGRAAGVLGDVDRQLRELNDGIRVVGPKDPLSYQLYDLTARTLLEVGDWKAGRTMRENALHVTNNRASKFFQAHFLAGIAARLLDKEGAKKYIAMAEELFAAVRSTNREWPEFRDLWEAALSDARGGVNSMFGHPKEAEADYRTCVTAIRSYLAKNRKGNDVFYYYLPQCLSRAMEHAAIVGKIREAGAYINDAREAARILVRDSSEIISKRREWRGRSVACIWSRDLFAKRRTCWKVPSRSCRKQPVATPAFKLRTCAIYWH